MINVNLITLDSSGNFKKVLCLELPNVPDKGELISFRQKTLDGKKTNEFIVLSREWVLDMDDELHEVNLYVRKI